MTLSKPLELYREYIVLLNDFKLLCFLYFSPFSKLLKLSTLDPFKQNNRDYRNLSKVLHASLI